MDANIKTPQDALEWLERHIHKEAEADGEMTNEHAIQLGFIQNMLAKFPRRNCDVGTAKEQVKRWRRFCNSMTTCGECPCQKSYSEVVTDCFSRWAQLPYEEGGDK